jgi:hypothetical protein
MFTVSIIPDEPEYDIIFDASPQSIASQVTCHTAEPELKADEGKAIWNTNDTPGTKLAQSFSPDVFDGRKQSLQASTKGKFLIAFSILVCLSIAGVGVWAILAVEMNDSIPTPEPSIQPSLSSAPTASTNSQPSRPPDIMTGAPTSLASSVPATFTPSTSPSEVESLVPTPVGAISFNVPYDIFIPNGQIHIVPLDEYIPALIDSMDLLTYEIIFNIDENGEFIGDMAETFGLNNLTSGVGSRQRRNIITSVLLPTQVTAVVNVDCPQPTSTDLCQRVDAYITLQDAENTWRQFRATTVLALQIGRLQFHLDRVDPNSPTEVMDAMWVQPPSPTSSPSQPPIRRCSLLYPCTPSASPSSESSSSPFPSDLPSVMPSLSLSASPFEADSSSPTTLTLNALSPIPSPSISSTTFDLFNFLVDNSFDSGLALSDESSPQHRAYLWLEFDTFLDKYPHWRILQRYALATLHIATNGGTWLSDDLWLSNESECEWYTTARSRESCNSNNQYINLELDGNNLEGILPPELALLSSSLESFVLKGGPEQYLSGTIPSEYGLMTKLSVFSVRDGNLSGVVPSEIGKMTNLVQLDISRNNVSLSVRLQCFIFLTRQNLLTEFSC